MRPPRNAASKIEAEDGYNPGALRGRLMVGRLTLDQVVGVRVPAPQPRKAAAQAAFSFPDGQRQPAWVNVATAGCVASLERTDTHATARFERLASMSSLPANSARRSSSQPPPNNVQTARCAAENSKASLVLLRR
jgi:hypothetical protein